MTETMASTTLRILHETRYQYASVVDTAQHVAHLQPPHTACQTVHAHTLRIEPEGAQVHTNLDAFGNHRTYFALPSLHNSARLGFVGSFIAAPPHTNPRR